MSYVNILILWNEGRMNKSTHDHFGTILNIYMPNIKNIFTSSNLLFIQDSIYEVKMSIYVVA